MDSRPFLTLSRGSDMLKAFRRAVFDATPEHRNDGATGTIAEKLDFLLVYTPEGERTLDFARAVLEFDPDKRVDYLECLSPATVERAGEVFLLADGTWGPAIGIELSDEETAGHAPLGSDRLFVFFGFAPVGRPTPS